MISQYDDKDVKSKDAALYYNMIRGNRQCTGINTNESSIRVVRLTELKDKTNDDKDVLFCRSGDILPFKAESTSDLVDCYVDATPATAVFVRLTLADHELDNTAHAFLALSERFGKMGNIEDVFELFGKFETGQPNVLFSDDAVKLSQAVTNLISHEEEIYNRLPCRT